MGVAKTEKDANIFDEIKDRDNNYYQRYIWDVARETEDNSVCEKLEDPQANIIQDEIDECYYILGYYSHKASACSAVKELSF